MGASIITSAVFGGTIHFQWIAAPCENERAAPFWRFGAISLLYTPACCMSGVRMWTMSAFFTASGDGHDLVTFLLGLVPALASLAQPNDDLEARVPHVARLCRALYPVSYHRDRLSLERGEAQLFIVPDSDHDSFRAPSV